LKEPSLSPDDCDDLDDDYGLYEAVPDDNWDDDLPFGNTMSSKTASEITKMTETSNIG